LLSRRITPATGWSGGCIRQVQMYVKRLIYSNSPPPPANIVPKYAGMGLSIRLFMTIIDVFTVSSISKFYFTVFHLYGRNHLHETAFDVLRRKDI
jgi:hypothetical protein